MRTLALALIAVCLAASCLAQGGDAPKLQRTAAQATEHANALRAAYDKHRDAFEGINGGISVHETSIEGTLKLCEEHTARIQNLEQNVIPEVQPLLSAVLELWGNPEIKQEETSAQDPVVLFAMKQAAEIEWNMKQAGAQDLDRVSTCFVDLTRMLNDVGKTRKANGEYLANDVKNLYGPDMISFFTEDIRVPKLKEAQTLLGWALKFDPKNEAANARMATIDAEIAALEKQIEAETDARTWAGNVGDFPGPGSTSELAAAALSYLRNDRDWGKAENGTEVLAVCVRGGWQPADRDIFGRIISWRLPVHVAATRPALKERGLARVYELSMVGMEGAPGNAPKAPPFDGFWVGDSWNIRLDKLPK